MLFNSNAQQSQRFLAPAPPPPPFFFTPPSRGGEGGKEARLLFFGASKCAPLTLMGEEARNSGQPFLPLPFFHSKQQLLGLGWWLWSWRHTCLLPVFTF